MYLQWYMFTPWLELCSWSNEEWINHKHSFLLTLLLHHTQKPFSLSQTFRHMAQKAEVVQIHHHHNPRLTRRGDCCRLDEANSKKRLGFLLRISAVRMSAPRRTHKPIGDNTSDDKSGQQEASRRGRRPTTGAHAGWGVRVWIGAEGKHPQ